MKLNSIALMLAIAALSGCAAKSVSLTYYLLHAPEKNGPQGFGKAREA